MSAKKRETITYLIPLFILLCLHPLFLQLYKYDNGLENYAWIAKTEGCMDLFLHGKMLLFECICAACVICLICYLFRENRAIHMPKMFLLLAGYAVLAFASTLLSDYRQFGFSGIQEQFENIWCLIGYMLVIVYAYIMVQNKKSVRFLSYALLIGACVIGFIGVSQFIGHDLLMTGAAKQLYIPNSLRGTLLDIAFGIGTVYATLYNPGYVGLYTSLICPILIIMTFYDQKMSIRILAGVACVLLVISTVGSQTVGGYIGLGVSFCVLLVMMLKKCISSGHNRIITVLSCGVLIALVFGCTVLQPNIIQHAAGRASVDEAANESETINEAAADSEPAYHVTEPVNDVVSAESAAQCKLETIQETDDYVEFCYNGIYFREMMNIRDNAVYLDFTNQQGEPITYDYDEASMIYTLTEPGLEGITSYSVNILDTYIGFITNIDGKDWTFTYTYKGDDLSYYTINAYNKLDKNITSESAVFTDHYRLFNGRGYIWAKTIPLLKEYIILGSGADSFTFVFPQSDYLSAYKSGYENMLITKPHNIYLQTAVQTGVLSLVLLLVFYAIYAIDCLRLYFMKQIADDGAAYAIAIFAGTTGFLVLSLINDSTICVTPVFCALLGTGLALNRINHAKEPLSGD